MNRNLKKHVQFKYSIFLFFYLLVSKTTQQSEKVTEGTANWTTLQSLALEQNKSLAIELQGLIKLDEI